MIRMRIWVMMVIVPVIMSMPVFMVIVPVFMVIVPVIMVFMPMVMVQIKPASPRTKTVAELTILDITSRG
jgi:uncharacterized membrane protein